MEFTTTIFYLNSSHVASARMRGDLLVRDASPFPKALEKGSRAPLSKRQPVISQENRIILNRLILLIAIRLKRLIRKIISLRPIITSNNFTRDLLP